MSNPFESADDTYVVLMNELGQYSLWPSFALVPAGWTQVFGQASREACLSHIETRWTDMRPQAGPAEAAASAPSAGAGG
ncbi:MULTISPECIES: MbtH family protein [Paenibacillus]|uniref:MbtH family protein n=1 Tax=Paenibacillus TaxID=44249 RepID=UPI0022B91F78|nr:MbtH family protein [Paenibacillus caseinilyticus]MCZ8519578.1 MbtH family protein [Paenibacillus caseinilyticus]